MKKISGIIPALITPFNKGGNVDFDSLGQLVEKTLAGGASGFYVTGTSGEAFLLSDAERRDILRFVARVNNGRAVLIAHVGAMSTGKACAFARIAAEAGYCFSIYTPHGEALFPTTHIRPLAPSDSYKLPLCLVGPTREKQSANFVKLYSFLASNMLLAPKTIQTVTDAD